MQGVTDAPVNNVASVLINIAGSTKRANAFVNNTGMKSLWYGVFLNRLMLTAVQRLTNLFFVILENFQFEKLCIRLTV